MVIVLMMSAKMDTLDLFKIQVFWNKGYDVIVFVHDVNNKLLLRASCYIADVIMRSQFGNSRISMRDGMAWDMVLKFYTSVAKGLKSKFKTFWGLILTFAEVTGEELAGGLFATPILNRINFRCIIDSNM